MTEPHETSAGAAGGREAMSDERLAEVRRRHAAYAKSHNHMGAFACCSAHASADTVPELVAEAERLRVENAHLRDELDRQEFNLRMKWGQELGDRLNEIAPDVMKEAALRAEAAERELAGMRERTAADLEAISDQCGADADQYADERSRTLEAEEGAYWEAARRIRSGEIGRVVGEWKAADSA